MKKITFIMVAVSLLFVACSNNNPKEKESTQANMERTSKGNLKSELDAKKANFEEKADEEKKKVYAEGILAVAESGILTSAMQVGDTAPDFSLKNANNETVSLSAMLKEGPVVLTWYRGGWCPYCNLTLHYLQQELPNFIAAGASLIALTPELPDNSISTKEKNELSFEVLSDVGSVVGKKYGVIFELTPEVAKRYQAGFGLHDYNGDSSNTLPLAATYIIHTSGIIEYAFLDADYRNRAEPSELTNILKEMKE